MRCFWELCKQEFGKLLYNRKMWIVIGVLLLLNAASLVYTEHQSAKEIPFCEYRNMNKKLSNMSDEEKSQYIDREFERADAFETITFLENLKENPQMQAYRESALEENKEIYEKYIDQYREQKENVDEVKQSQTFAILNEIKKEKDEVEQYPLLLEEIQSKAENMNQISIFRESVDEFSKKSIQKTADTYKKMENTLISYQISKGIVCFTKVSITDIFMLLFVFSLSCIVLLEEKQKNLLCLIKSTKNGRARTMAAKMAVSFGFLFGMCVLLYGMNLLYYGGRVGYGNLQASLQSLKPFIYSVLSVNVGEYLLLFLGCKLLVWVIAAWLLFLFAMFAKSYAAVFIECLAITGGSYLVWSNIKAGFVAELWHYENLAGWLNVNEIFQTYKNMKVGKGILDVQKLNGTVWLILLLLLTAALVILFEKKKDTGKTITITGIRWIKGAKIKDYLNRKRHMSESGRLYQYEFYKLWVLEHMYIFVILLMIFCIYGYHHFRKNISYEENVYRNYMKALEGELTPEKEQLILAEEEKYEWAQLKVNEIEDRVSAGSIGRQDAMKLKEPYEEILQTQDIFEKVLERYEYVKKHPGTCFVYDSGYKKLFRIQKYSFLESDILLVIMLVLCGTPLFIMEYQTGMLTVLRATPKGQRATAGRKIGACIFTGVVICSILIGYEIGRIRNDYGLNGMNASVTSLPYFEKLPRDISIGSFMVIMYGVRILVALCILLCILFVSLLIKNNLWTMLASGGILLIPMLLLLWKVDTLKVISIIPALHITQGIGHRNMAWQSAAVIGAGVGSLMEIVRVYSYGNSLRCKDVGKMIRIKGRKRKHV